jgi:hypothetical protein
LQLKLTLLMFILMEHSLCSTRLMLELQLLMNLNYTGANNAYRICIPARRGAITTVAGTLDVTIDYAIVRY